MKKYLVLLSTILYFVSCQEERPELGDPPSASDAQFSITPDASTPNILNFTSNASEGRVFWDFGNGTSAQGKQVQGVFPLKGDYTITSEVFTQGGKAVSSNTINIANDDLTLLQDSLLTWLTGGVNNTDGKTWVVDSSTGGHIGVGPVAKTWPEWYAATPNEKSGVGLYNDRYTFKLLGFGFDMKVNGDVYLHNSYKDDFPGSYENKFDYTAPYTDKLNETWSLSFLGGGDTTLTLSGGAWMGLYTGALPFQVMEMSRDLMVLKTVQGNDAAAAWYVRLIPEGLVTGGGGGGPTGFALPFDFETVEPAFNGFGGSTASVEDNADKRGQNTSDRVLETIHGFESWAGIEVNLDSKLDFTTDSLIKVKVWSERMGGGDTLRVKIEDQNDNNVFLERDVAIPVATNWIEVEVSFAGAASGTYDKLVLFPGWNTTEANTYQLDDIRQDK